MLTLQVELNLLLLFFCPVLTQVSAACFLRTNSAIFRAVICWTSWLPNAQPPEHCKDHGELYIPFCCQALAFFHVLILYIVGYEPTIHSRGSDSPTLPLWAHVRTGRKESGSRCTQGQWKLVLAGFIPWVHVIPILVTRVHPNLRVKWATQCICNCWSYFTTAKISFTSILYPHFTHIIFIIYNSQQCIGSVIDCHKI